MKTMIALAFLFFLMGCQPSFPTCEQFDITTSSISLSQTGEQNIDIIVGCSMGRHEIDLIAIHQGNVSFVFQTKRNPDLSSMTATFSSNALLDAGFSEGPAEIIPIRVNIFDFNRIQERKMGENIYPPYYRDSKTIQIVR